MIQRLINSFWPPTAIERDPIRVAQASLFIGAFSAALTVQVFLLFIFLIFAIPIMVWFAAIACILLMIGLFYFRWRDDFRVPSHLINAFYLVYFHAYMNATAGSSQNLSTGIFSVTIFNYFTLGFGAAMLWSTLGVLLLLAHIYYPELGFEFLKSGPVADLNSIAAGDLLGNIAFVYLYIIIYQSVFKIYRRRNDELRLEGSHLLHVVSHDLRSPLQIIQSYSQLLQNGQLEKKDDYVKQIQKALERMTLVLNNVRDYERVANGEKDLKLVPVDLSEVLDEAIENVSTVYRDKQIQVKIFKGSEKLPLVWAEPLALTEQVLGNFLSNAFKFSSENSTVNIEIYKKNSCVYLIIRDHGIGMPSDIKEKLFKFSKTSTRPGSKGEKGTGFGMPIAKLFLDQMGVSFSIDSWDLHEFPDKKGTRVCLGFKTV